MKLSRLLARHEGRGREWARRVLAAGEVRLREEICRDGQVEVDRFARVELADGEVLQAGERSLHLMLHKPAGVVSATTDPEHRTVIDLIDDADRDTLHLAGRLDRFTTGLMLLTNDGAWSKRITEKAFELPKTYLVETAEDLDPAAVEAFARGFHFPTEDIVTRPAELTLLGPRRARLVLREGRYHQVKRMFHRVQNRVRSLHREQVGSIRLPDDLAPGKWRPLTDEERDSVWRDAAV